MMPTPSVGAPASASGPAVRVPSELRDLEIAVAVPSDEDGTALIRALHRTRNRVRHIAAAAEPLPVDCDVVVAEFNAQLIDRIPWGPGDPLAALIVVLPVTATPDLVALKGCAPDAALHKPFTAPAVLAALMLSRSNFLYQRRLRQRIEKLDDTLRTIRTVERAKAILMQTRQIGEDEAYRFLRRRAMDRQVSINAVAAAVVDAHEIVG